MNKLKSFFIILLLILLTFSFLKLPEYFFEKSNLRILETKENLTYNYEVESISPSQLAELFCSGELEFYFSFIDEKEIDENFNEEIPKEKTDTLLKNLFKDEYSDIYSILSDISSGLITDYYERNVFVQSPQGKPIALNFIVIAFMKDYDSFNICFEEKTQTVFFLDYIPSINTSKNYNQVISTASKINMFFDNYFNSVLNTKFYNINTYTEKELFIYCSNSLIMERETDINRFDAN